MGGPFIFNKGCDIWVLSWENDFWNQLLCWFGLRPKKQRSFHGGVQLSFPPWWGQSGEQFGFPAWATGLDLRNRFQQFTKQTEKHHSPKSKISIKEVVSKFRYFQHACQSGPKINHSRSIHLSALPKHLGDWCLIGIVSFITNIFHRGGIIHKTETKKGHKNCSDSDCDAWLLYF